MGGCRYCWLLGETSWTSWSVSAAAIGLSVGSMGYGNGHAHRVWWWGWGCLCMLWAHLFLCTLWHRHWWISRCCRHSMSSQRSLMMWGSFGMCPSPPISWIFVEVGVTWQTCHYWHFHLWRRHTSLIIGGWAVLLSFCRLRWHSCHLLLSRTSP